jgi:shikimate 5-dehydrogenase
MLLRQTAAAFNLWTGRDVPMDLLKRRLDEVRESQTTVTSAIATD